MNRKIITIVAVVTVVLILAILTTCLVLFLPKNMDSLVPKIKKTEASDVKSIEIVRSAVDGKGKQFCVTQTENYYIETFLDTMAETKCPPSYLSYKGGTKYNITINLSDGGVIKFEVVNAIIKNRKIDNEVIEMFKEGMAVCTHTHNSK